MIKEVKIIILLFFALIVSGCEEVIENTNLESRKLDEIINLVSEEHIDNIITHEYSNSELKKISNLDLNLEDLDKKYRIEYIKKDKQIDTIYQVIYKSKNKYLIIDFHENGEKGSNFIQSMSMEKSRFDFIKIGKTKKWLIYLKDKGNAEYSLKSSPFTSGGYSRHYTKDGYLVILHYKENVVEEMSVEPL